MHKILALFLLIGTLSASSQDSHMSINMGASVPLGDFASTGNFLENGYTQTGFNLNIDGNYIPTWYFGIGGNISFSTYVLDDNAVEKDLIELIDNLPDMPDLPNNIDARIAVGTWSYANFMLGPVFAYPISNFQLNVKALFGLSILMPPGNELNVINNETGQEVSSYTDQQNARFGYLLGADVIYKLSGTYSLKLGGEYFHSKTNYDIHFSQINEASPDTEYETQTSNISVDALHLTVGIAYLF